jgi:hypothetical protein
MNPRHRVVVKSLATNHDISACSFVGNALHVSVVELLGTVDICLCVGGLDGKSPSGSRFTRCSI